MQLRPPIGALKNFQSSITHLPRSRSPPIPPDKNNQLCLLLSSPQHHLLSTQSHIMASRQITRALRSPLAKQLNAPARRTFVSAVNAATRRPAARAAVAASQQVRGVKTIDFAGTKEKVYGKAPAHLNGCEWHANSFHRACRLAPREAPGESFRSNAYLCDQHTDTRVGVLQE